MMKPDRAPPSHRNPHGTGPKADDATLRRSRRMVRLHAYSAPLPLLGLFVLAASDSVPCGPDPCTIVLKTEGPGVLLHAMTGSLVGGVLGTLTLVLILQALRWQHRLAHQGGRITWF